MDFDAGIAALIMGFILGLKHATDADHVVAVATIVNEFKNAFRALWVGVSWGLGHTVPLLILGIVIIVFKNVVMDSYEAVALYFEFGVGVMLSPGIHPSTRLNVQRKPRWHKGRILT